MFANQGGGSPLLGPRPVNVPNLLAQLMPKKKAPAAAPIMGGLRTEGQLGQVGGAPAAQNPIQALIARLLQVGGPQQPQGGAGQFLPGGPMQGAQGAQVDPGFNLGPIGPSAPALGPLKKQMQQMRQHMVAARIAQLQKSFHAHTRGGGAHHPYHSAE